MSVPMIKTSFSAGEITPGLFGHVDLSRFSLGASTQRNIFTSYRGGAYSRAGTKFVGYSKQTGRTVPPRMITFQFSINQGLALEFGNFYMRVISNGAFVTDTAKNISAATNANPGVITVVGHGYSTGDWAFLSGVNGMTQLNGQTYIVFVLSPNTFSLTDVFGNAVDTSGFGVYTGGGTAARIFTLATPWAEADLTFLKFTESADVMSLCCWNQTTGTSYVQYDLSREANNAWTLTAIDPQPTIDAPSSCSGSASAAGTTDFQYVATTINMADGTESVASPIGDVPNSVDIGSVLGAITINWVGPNGASKFNVYKATPTFNGTVPPGAVFGYIGTAFGTQFIDSNITPDFSQVPPTFTNPFAPGAISDVNITSGGSGQTTVTWAITTATGSGFDGFPVVIGGVMTEFIVTKHGKNYKPGDTIAFNGAGFAGGSIAFAAQPSDTDTITLNGDVWTFVAAITAGNQTLIQSTLALTMTQLVADLSASADAQLIVAGYSQSGGNTLVVRYKTAGAAGNAYTLASSSINGTPSAGTLTGGSGIGGTDPVGTLDIGPNSGTYPSTVGYFQQRRVYAGSPNNPDTYWMSVPGAFTNFDVRNPTVDSDSITGTPWSVQVNGIQFMVAMPGGLVVLTGLAAWQLTGAGGSSLNPQPLTPSNQQAQPQAYNGCNNHVFPIKISFDILYVQAKGSIVRDLNYNFFVNIYTGQDITVLSSHLFTGYTIEGWAWAEEPFKIIWAIRNDGIALTLTYLKEQEVNAWARSDTQGLFKSVCSVTEPPVDAVYFATQRFTPQATAANDNCYMIERMDDRLWQTIEDVWAVDAALEITQPTPNATLFASSATGIGSLVGITNLVGGSGYSNATVGTVVDDAGNGPGSGATVALTIVGGVITNVTFPVPGTLYVNPSLTITDPNGGSGASGNPIVSNLMTFTISSPIFIPGHVGSVIRSGGGCALITAYVNPTTVRANMRSPIVAVIQNGNNMPIPQTAGNWTLTPQVQTVTGLNHLIGMMVTGLADGKVIAPIVVSATGSIGLATPASAITVGLGFQAQLQSVYLDEGSPSVQGQRKKIAAVTARIELSQSFSIGSNQTDGSTLSPAQVSVRWSQMKPAPNIGEAPYLPSVPYPYIQAPALAAPLPLYTGDVRIPVTGGYNKPGQVAVQQDNPLPLQVLALIPEVLPGDTPSVKEKDQGPGRRRAA